MDRGKVKSDFGGASNDLLHVRKELSWQIKRERREIKSMMKQVKRRKAGVLRLAKQKKAIEGTIVNISEIRNNLVFITNEKVPTPTWSSSSEESDLNSSSDECDTLVGAMMITWFVQCKCWVAFYTQWARIEK